MTPAGDATMPVEGGTEARRATNAPTREGLDGPDGSEASERPYATGGTIYGLGLKGPVFDRDHVIYPDGSHRCVTTIRWDEP